MLKGEEKGFEARLIRCMAAVVVRLDFREVFVVSSA